MGDIAIGIIVFIGITVAVVIVNLSNRAIREEVKVLPNKPIFFCYNIDGKKGCTTQCKECQIKEKKETNSPYQKGTQKLK